MKKKDTVRKMICWVGGIFCVAVMGVAAAEGVSATSYSIKYDDNVVSDMPMDEASSTLDTSVNIAVGVPVRSGYKFLGWCPGTVTTADGVDSCSSATIYNPNGGGTNLAYTIDQTSGSNALGLKAMWKEICVGYTKMQGLTASAVASLLPNIDDTVTMCDMRDDQTYVIAKLKDGKYWMVENLNLAGGTVLSADDTDVTSIYISSYIAGDSRLNKSGNTLILPTSSALGFNVANYSYVYNSGNKTDCDTSSENIPCYSYYSWDAATLGSGRNISSDNTDAEQSICPKGWRLPKSRTESASNWRIESDFYVLAHQYGLDSTTSTSEFDKDFYTQAGPGTTPNFQISGRYDSNSFSYGGGVGTYWSSTSNPQNEAAHSLLFYNGRVYSASTDYRNVGYSVRCLFSG